MRKDIASRSLDHALRVSLLFLTALAPWTVPRIVSADDQLPNILVVVVDDVGVEVLRAYEEGGACSTSSAPCREDGDCQASESCEADYPSTPNIDALRARGLLFRNAWANPLCPPTRATIQTGRHGFRTGVLAVDDGLPLLETAIPRVIENSHSCAAFGKWHLGGSRFGPNNHGYSHFAGAKGNLRGRIGLCELSGSPCRDPEDCPRKNEVCGSFAQRQTYFSWIQTVNGEQRLIAPEVRTPAGYAAVYATTVHVNAAVEWIEAAQEPWFVYFAFNSPHALYHVPPHHLISPATLNRLRLFPDFPLLPAGMTCPPYLHRSCYVAMVEAMDAELGRLLSHVSEHTVVLFLADNGTSHLVVRPPFLPEHAKETMYEGGLNVPLLVAGAGVGEIGEEVVSLVHSVDLFSTVLELAGGSIPSDRRIDSVSLVPYLSDSKLSLRRDVFAEQRDEKAIRDRRFKLIFRSGRFEFYDLLGNGVSEVPDPLETRDLLEGVCSGVGGRSCRIVEDCPPGSRCDLPDLSPVQQEGLMSLRKRLDIILDSCGPDGCPEDAPCWSRVTGLQVVHWEAEASSLSWRPVGAAVSYQVIRGDMAALARSDGNFSATSDACRTDEVSKAAIVDPEQPGSGEIFWYLVRPVSSVCRGTFGSGGMAQVGHRDWRSERRQDCRPLIRPLR